MRSEEAGNKLSMDTARSNMVSQLTVKELIHGNYLAARIGEEITETKLNEGVYSL